MPMSQQSASREHCGNFQMPTQLQLQVSASPGVSSGRVRRLLYGNEVPRISSREGHSVLVRGSNTSCRHWISESLPAAMSPVFGSISSVFEDPRPAMPMRSVPWEEENEPPGSLRDDARGHSV